MNILGLQSSDSFIRLQDLDVYQKKVLLRIDINVPLDRRTKKIANKNRILESMPSLQYLCEQEAAVVIIAHQGDSLDYINVCSLYEHAQVISAYIDRPVRFIDDIAGPYARECIARLQPGEILLLDNLRYLSEEISVFDDVVKLSVERMTKTYLVRNLSPLFDYVVIDAFSAAHRRSPSILAFQELLPSAVGIQFHKEITALSTIHQQHEQPCCFLLGGAKVSDAFSMIESAFTNKIATKILCGGLPAMVFLYAKGVCFHENYIDYLERIGALSFLPIAVECLKHFEQDIILPVDLACDVSGNRKTVSIDEFSAYEGGYDIGVKSVERFMHELSSARIVIVNGPMGCYEEPQWSLATQKLWQFVAQLNAYTVIGGGDTVAAAVAFAQLSAFSYVSTGGGAMLRYISGVHLPLIESLKSACERTQRKTPHNSSVRI